MSTLTPSAVRKAIASGRTAPLYLILGDDEVEKAALAGEFAEALDEGLRPFNLDRFSGADVSVAALLNAVRTLPMMARRRVVIVLRAERLLVPKRDTEAAQRELDALETYLNAPAPSTTLVMTASDLDKRRRIVSTLLRQAAVVECGGLEDLSDAVRWVRARLAEARVEAEPEAVRLLAAGAGPNVVRLRADVERLLLYALGRRKISTEDVREVGRTGGVVLDEWAVARAIEQRDVGRALRELGLMLQKGAVPLMVLGQLGWIARSKMPPARAPKAIEAVFRTDLDLKSSAGDPRILLERLVIELCGA